MNYSQSDSKIKGSASDVLEALASVLTPLVARELAERNAPTLYSTERPELWPPKCRSRRAARERIRAVPGHTREGLGPATIWRVDAEAYRAHYTHRRAPIVQPPTSTDEQLAERALAAAGLRATRRAS